MHLVSARAQSVTVSGRKFEFAAGETIHTENCHKYDVTTFAECARNSGWTLERAWKSDGPEFGILLLK
jgi:uncharacterized SAM-dependent methyltransferase